MYYVRASNYQLRKGYKMLGEVWMEAESTLGKSYIQPELIYSFFIFVLVWVQKDCLTNGGDILYTRAHLPFMLVKHFYKNKIEYGQIWVPSFAMLSWLRISLPPSTCKTMNLTIFYLEHLDDVSEEKQKATMRKKTNGNLLTSDV